MNMAVRWLWCPMCQRAFRPVVQQWHGAQTFSAKCTYDGCEGRSGVPWERMRQKEPHFPLRPALNTLYERTPKRDNAPRPQSPRAPSGTPGTINQDRNLAKPPTNHNRVAPTRQADQYCQVCHSWKSPSAFRSHSAVRCDACWRQAPVSDRFKGRPYDGI